MFIVIFIIPSYAAIGCVNSSGKNPSLRFHQIPENKRKEIRQEWLRHIKHGQEWKISSRGFGINLLRAFWKRLFWKRSASKFYQIVKSICRNIHRNKKQALSIFLKVFVGFFFLGIFRNFQGKSMWRNSFLDELHIVLLKKDFLVDILCRNIPRFFLITFSKSTPALLLLKHFAIIFIFWQL